MSERFVLVKAGNSCNLACRYCGDDLAYEGERMPLSRWSALSEQLGELPEERVIVAWHGGEPTTAGLLYARRVAAALRAGARTGQDLFLCLHTNGSLFDEGWAEACEELGVSVSVSLDGPRRFHERYRPSAADPSFEGALRALRLLRGRDLSVAVSVTVHEDSWSITEELVRICVDEGVDILHFEPRLSRAHVHNRGPIGRSVSPENFARFVSSLMSAIRRSGDRLAVPELPSWAEPGGEVAPVGCVFSQVACRRSAVVDWRGDVWPCDLFHGRPEARLGNIWTSRLVDIFSGERARHHWSGMGVPTACTGCSWESICGGGCLYHRTLQSAKQDRPTPYCVRPSPRSPAPR